MINGVVRNTDKALETEEFPRPKNTDPSLELDLGKYDADNFEAEVQPNVFDNL